MTSEKPGDQSGEGGKEMAAAPVPTPTNEQIDLAAQGLKYVGDYWTHGVGLFIAGLIWRGRGRLAQIEAKQEAHEVHLTSLDKAVGGHDDKIDANSLAAKNYVSVDDLRRLETKMDSHAASTNNTLTSILLKLTERP